MTGVLEWRNESVRGAYPLARGIVDNDLLVDAQFVCFDNFVPTLKSYQVDSGSLNLTVTLEDGDCVVQLAADIADGTKVPINLTRYRGFVVVGPGALRLLAYGNSKPVVCRAPFLSTVVISVSSSAGVYSLAGAHGELRIKPDENIRVSSQLDNSIIFNAIGLPARKETITLVADDNLIYGVTSKKLLMKVNVMTGTHAVMGTLDRVYTCMVTTPAGKIYGVAGSKLYDLNQIPATFVMNLISGVKGLHCTAGGVLYAAGTGVAIIDPVARTETPLVTFAQDKQCAGGLTHGPTTNKLFLVIAGTHTTDPLNPPAELPALGVSLYTADRLAEFDITTHDLKIIGNITATIPNSSRQAMSGVYALANTPSKLFGWCYFVDPTVQYPLPPVEWDVALNISPTSGAARVLRLNFVSTLTGFMLGTTKGNNAQMVMNNFQALKKLNSQSPQSNSIMIDDSSLLNISNTAPGVLTIGLPEITGLQLSRAKKFSIAP